MSFDHCQPSRVFFTTSWPCCCFVSLPSDLNAPNFKKQYSRPDCLPTKLVFTEYFNFYAFGNLSWVVICVLAGYGGGGNNFNSDNFGSNYGGSNSNFGPMKGGGGGYGGGRGQGPYQCKE